MINSQIKSPIGNPEVIKIWKFFLFSDAVIWKSHGIDIKIQVLYTCSCIQQIKNHISSMEVNMYD